MSCHHFGDDITSQVLLLPELQPAGAPYLDQLCEKSIWICVLPISLRWPREHMAESHSLDLSVNIPYWNFVIFRW